MKQSKHLVLFLLSLASRRGGSLSYAQLYASLPLAPSTIRGILSSFRLDGSVESDMRGEERFRLTSVGQSRLRVELPGLTADSVAYTCLILFVESPSASARRRLESLGLTVFRAGLWLDTETPSERRTRELSRIQTVGVVIPLLTQTAAAILSLHRRERRILAYIRERSQCLRLLRNTKRRALLLTRVVSYLRKRPLAPEYIFSTEQRLEAIIELVGDAVVPV